MGFPADRASLAVDAHFSKRPRSPRLPAHAINNPFPIYRNRRWRVSVRFFVGLFLGSCALGCISGCATDPTRGPGFAYVEPLANRAPLLAQELAGIVPSPAATEARNIARVALEATAAMRARWRPVGSALVNNLLVNMKYRERGLCYQWTNDLLEPLEALNLKYFDLYWGTAYWGDRLKEHNSVVVVLRGRPFSEGLVLDAWRFGGRLVWVRVRDDSKYPWRELTPLELVQFRPLARPPSP